MTHRCDYTSKKSLKNNIEILYLWIIEEHKGLISTSKHVPALRYRANPGIDDLRTYYKFTEV